MGAAIIHKEDEIRVPSASRGQPPFFVKSQRSSKDVQESI